MRKSPSGGAKQRGRSDFAVLDGIRETQITERHSRPPMNQTAPLGAWETREPAGGLMAENGETQQREATRKATVNSAPLGALELD